MEYMTNRMRVIHQFNREYQADINEIVQAHRSGFFPTIELLKGLKNIIILDFDGVLTSKRFNLLYKLCTASCKTIICTANPAVDKTWFEKNGLPLPKEIYAVKGKWKKVKTIVNLSKRYDNVFYVDDELEYLKFAWLFGIKTFHYCYGKIKHFSLNTK